MAQTTHKQLEEQYGKDIVKRVKARRGEGGDKATWAVFIDDRRAYSGVLRSELTHYKNLCCQVLERSK